MPGTALIRYLLVLCALLPGAPRADDALWSLLRAGGQVVLLRHDTTDPGVGDPPGMTLADCSTQRNLSEEGRAHARRLGEALRSRAIPVAGLQASPWCRCLETARLAFGRSGEVQPALGNLFGRREEEAPQVAQLRRIVERVPEGGNLFLVTHGSTVMALTGVSPAMGEMVVLTPQRAGAFRVAGRLSVP
ncbi:histidine phosphatase family protein [Ramlibacter sp. AN1133]|uniref:histidine phosphatase family protein n=1 Tax=Ramlibacter sp. AN1133 TaxID=3133429 RepID=UPI0030BD0D76